MKITFQASLKTSPNIAHQHYAPPHAIKVEFICCHASDEAISGANRGRENLIYSVLVEDVLAVLGTLKFS